MRKLVFFITCLLISVGHSKPDAFRYPFYVGGFGGYGSTTWQGLVPRVDNQNIALSLSTPIKVNEGGAVWGGFGGYEVSENFAIEANYQHYPTASVIFDEDSLFAFEQDGETLLSTETQTASVSGKIMLTLPKTCMRLFSSAGIAWVKRNDYLSQSSNIAPTFGFGVNVTINQRVMGEIAASYTAGYGESELNPVEDYVPFLYAILAKLAYRF